MSIKNRSRPFDIFFCDGRRGRTRPGRRDGCTTGRREEVGGCVLIGPGVAVGEGRHVAAGGAGVCHGVMIRILEL